MTQDELRRKALVAAASVVLAFGPGCAAHSGAVEPAAEEPGAVEPAAEERLAAPSGEVQPSADPNSPPQCDNLSVSDCCDARKAWCSAQMDPGSESYTECVYGLGADGSTGCVPWGPAAPPRARV